MIPAALLVVACTAASPGAAAANPHTNDAPGATLRQAGGCGAVDAIPTAATFEAANVVTLCLLNAQRTTRGLRALVRNPQLDAAAVGYAQEMVAGRFFGHVSPAGSTMNERIGATGYLTGDWLIGENLGWASGTLATPAMFVAAWMDSDGHRGNILNPDFAEIGMGLASGVPVVAAAGLPGATYVTEFGTRTPDAPVVDEPVVDEPGTPTATPATVPGARKTGCAAKKTAKARKACVRQRALRACAKKKTARARRACTKAVNARKR